MLFLYNTLTRKKESFKPIKDKETGVYTCGPTVYWYQHIGNLRTYISEDILKRVLINNGYKVKHVMNITDVGHLTSDADEGEDKIEKAAAKEGKKAEELANHYWEIFREDFKKLNIIEPNIWCKASEHIQEQLELIKKLEKKGFAYKTTQAIYFDVGKFKDYEKLSRQKLSEKKTGTRDAVVIDKEKKNAQDFALWFFTVGHFKNHIMKWSSPWGIGFPGWHTECSAMSMKYLGEHFDIHTGGIDHIPVHHTNEIAQSESTTGGKFVNYWIHGAFLTFKGDKISKSKGGLYTVADLEKMGFNPLVYRYFTFTAHYRTPLDFTLEGLKNAQNSYQRLKNIISGLKNDAKVDKKYLTDFEKSINNDLDMPKALAVLWKMVRDTKTPPTGRQAIGKIKTIAEMDKIFGLDLLKKETINIPGKINNLLKQREEARAKKDWQKSDALRQEAEKLGWIIEDTASGPVLRKK